jgi:hypothetical protein
MSGVIVSGKIINGKALELKLAQAFETWANEDLDDGFFEDQFKADKWDYPGETRRKNGEPPITEPRNIYDLGELYRSGKDSFRITQGGNDITASWNWDAKNDSGGAYAIYVHEGLGTNLEPRPWTDDLYVPAKFQASVVSKALRRRIKTALAG